MNLYTLTLEEFTTLKLARQHLPMWTDWGVEDVSSTLHSLGLTYLVTLGQALGYAACVEFPVDAGIRADVIWWDKSTQKPVAVFEFERHKDGSELLEKAKNLLLAFHRFERNPRMFGLVFWTKHFYPLEQTTLKGLWSIFQHGFRTSGGHQIPGADPKLLKVFEVLHQSGEKGRHRLKQIEERKRL